MKQFVSKVLSPNNPRVFLVDDDSGDRFLIEKKLRGKYSFWAEAVDGVEALEYLQKYAANVDILILDLNMPRRDGLEVLKTIQNDPLFKHLHIILLASLEALNRMGWVPDEQAQPIFYAPKEIDFKNLGTVFSDLVNVTPEKKSSLNH